MEHVCTNKLNVTHGPWLLWDSPQGLAGQLPRASWDRAALRQGLSSSLKRAGWAGGRGARGPLSLTFTTCRKGGERAMRSPGSGTEQIPPCPSGPEQAHLLQKAPLATLLAPTEPCPHPDRSSRPTLLRPSPGLSPPLDRAAGGEGKSSRSWCPQIPRGRHQQTQ